MELQDAIKSISENRLATYRNRLRLADDAECLGLYIWNKKLSGVFLPVLQLLEVSLRNAVHEGYLAHQKAMLATSPQPTTAPTPPDRGWFRTFFAANQSAHRESWRHIQSAEQALEKAGRPLDVDQLIAKLPYGFWANLCSRRHDEGKVDSLRLWPTIRHHVFPAAIRGRVHISMREIQETLAQVNDIRNRIAHHEPIWHAPQLYDLAAFINKLARDFKKCLDVIGWINPANLKTLTLMESAVDFAHLCRPGTIQSYRDLGDSFGPAPMVDAPAWEEAATVDERHNGIVICAPSPTIIKSLSDKQTFIMDNIGKWAIQSTLGLKLHEEVNFRPARVKNKAGQYILLARAAVRGHVADWKNLQASTTKPHDQR